jgi:acetolactate synthase-1/2/3 large subunit
VTFTSNGPGAANVAGAMFHARGANSPVVLLAGSHPTIEDRLGGGQEGYPADLLKDACKWTHRIVEPATMNFWIRKAFREAMQPNPGPVTLDFPAKILSLRGTQEQLKYVGNDRVAVVPATAGDPEFVRKVVTLLARAKRPVIIAADGVYWSDAARELTEFSEMMQIPTCTRRTARGALPETHPLAFTAAYRRGFLDQADVVCLIGQPVTALDEWFEPPDWNQAATWIQIQDVAENIWHGIPTDVAVVGSSKLVLRQMIAEAKALDRNATPDREPWLAKLDEVRRAISARQGEATRKLRALSPIHPQVLCAEIADFLDPDSTLIYDSFTISSFITSQTRATYAGQVLDAGLFQTLGHSIGMAIGAQVARPGRQVVSIIGDGGFGIAGMDMETMVRYGLPAIVVLYNNSAWGGRAWGHDQYYPHRNSGKLSEVRYDEMFRAVGCHTDCVTEVKDIRPALDRAMASGKPALINVIGETNATHPFRMRVNILDTWSRNNFTELPKEAQDEMRALPRSVFERTAKRSRDNLFGFEVSAEELMEMVGKQED